MAPDLDRRTRCESALLTSFDLFAVHSQAVLAHAQNLNATILHQQRGVVATHRLGLAQRNVACALVHLAPELRWK